MKKIGIGLGIISILGVISFLIWKFAADVLLYLHYENTSKVGISMLLSTIFADIIYIVWCIRSEKSMNMNDKSTVTFIVGSIVLVVIIMFAFGVMVLSDVWAAIVIHTICMAIGILASYIMGSNL